MSPALATAGQPIAEQFQAVQAAGYEVVVNLAMPDSPKALPEERSIVESLGMEYIAIPVVWEEPTLEDFQRFVAALQATGDRPVFVHCIANMRVSAFLYLYRHLILGMDEATVRQDLHHIWEPNDRWQAFINQVIGHYRSRQNPRL